MAERNKNIRQSMILAGIDEINANGVTEFSIRRVADACQISCAAPYRHFKDKREFIAAIVDFVNEQWHERQQQILSQCGDSLRQKIVAISVGYIRFLMEKPFFRSILILKDDQFDNLYHKARGQLSNLSQRLAEELFATQDWDEATQARKLLFVRALIFGSIVMFDNGELPYNDQTMEYIHYCIDREFDLP